MNMHSSMGAVRRLNVKYMCLNLTAVSGLHLIEVLMISRLFIVFLSTCNSS